MLKYLRSKLRGNMLVRNQDAVFVLNGTSREGCETAWVWFNENWDLILKRWGSGYLVARFVSSTVSGVCSSTPPSDKCTFNILSLFLLNTSENRILLNQI